MSIIQTETVLETKRIYEGKIISLRVDTIALEGGLVTQREVVEHRGAVAMVPMLDRDTVVLVRQYRTAAGRAMLEIPAGSLNKNEDIDACAHRELAEEINYRAASMIKLYASYQAPGYSTEVIHTYLAYGLAPVVGHGDEDEFIDIVTMPLKDAIALIGSGEIVDAKSVAGLLYVEKILPGIEWQEH